MSISPCGLVLQSYLKQKCLFSNIENRRIIQILSGGWQLWEGGRYGEYDRNIMYSCLKMEKQDPLKLFQEWEGAKGE
jgi:hypothetical protein